MVWILLVIGSLLVFLNFRAIKKDKHSFGSILQTTEEDMKDFEVSLGRIRREFAETILELQKEIQELKKDKNNGTNISEDLFDKNAKEDSRIEELVVEKDDDVKKLVFEEVKEEAAKESSNNVRIDEINKLLSEGFSVEDVSIRLGIGKGEVLLIKELYLK